MFKNHIFGVQGDTLLSNTVLCIWVKTVKIDLPQVVPQAVQWVRPWSARQRVVRTLEVEDRRRVVATGAEARTLAWGLRSLSDEQAVPGGGQRGASLREGRARRREGRALRREGKERRPGALPPQPIPALPEEPGQSGTKQ